MGGEANALVEKETLVVGIGNPIRGDDGVAWRVVEALQRDARWRNGVEFLQAHQLLIEFAESIAAYRRVLFIDAHTATLDVPVRVERLGAGADASPSTHHFSPAALLRLAYQLYGAEPEAWLVSVRAVDFSVGEHLSPEAEAAAEAAIEQVRALLAAPTTK